MQTVLILRDGVYATFDRNRVNGRRRLDQGDIEAFPAHYAQSLVDSGHAALLSADDLAALRGEVEVQAEGQVGPTGEGDPTDPAGTEPTPPDQNGSSEEGQSGGETPPPETTGQTDPTPPVEPVTDETTPPVEPTDDDPPPPATTELDITPEAAELAQANHINLAAVKGSGAEGRILKRDIEALIGNG